MRRAFFHGLLLLALLLPGSNARAGLLAEGTRVIYPAGSEGRSLMIANTSSWPVLVQTWVDEGEGQPTEADTTFVVLPAIFRLEPSAIEHIRIIHTGAALPEDRESLFWLNLHEVPPTDTDTDADDARLTLTFNTQLKVLYRPERIAAPDDLAGKLQFRLEQDDGDWCVWVYNPTPWHASLTSLGVDAADGVLSTDEPDLLLPPFETRCYHLGEGYPEMKGKVYFNLIGDSGFSEAHQKNI